MAPHRLPGDDVTGRTGVVQIDVAADATVLREMVGGRLCEIEVRQVRIGRQLVKSDDSLTTGAGCVDLVREAGLEPARPCGHQDLNLAWLPFHHSRARRVWHGGPVRRQSMPRSLRSLAT